MSKGKRPAARARHLPVPNADAVRARFLPWLSRLSPVFIFTIDDGGQSLRLAARNDSAALLTDGEAAPAADESPASPAMDPQVSGLLWTCLRTRACVRRDVVWRAISTGEERLMGLTAELAEPDAVVLSVEDRGADGSSRRKLAVMHALAELAACPTRSVLLALAVRLLRGYLGSEAADFREGSGVRPSGGRDGAYEVPVRAEGVALGVLSIPARYPAHSSPARYPAHSSPARYPAHSPRTDATADPDEPELVFLETFAVLLGESLARLDRERAHRELEESFRLLSDSAGAGIVMLDTEGRVLRWNAAAEQMYGYPAQEIIGKSFALLYTAEDVAHGKPEEDLRLARRKGSIQSEETARRRKDGGLLVINVKTTALLDEDGKLRGYSRIARDVTERKRREIELHNNLAALDKRVRELRCLYEVAALISDPAMPLASVMQSVTELVARAYQYPAITCVRIRVGADVYETDGFVETEWEQTSTIGTLSSHLGTLQICYREPRPEVDEGPFSEEERDLIESIGQLLGDFLERRTTAGELRRTNALLETLFASTNYKIAFLDAEFRYIRVNEAYSRSWGQDPRSYVGRSHFDLFPGDEDIFRRVLRTGTPYMAADKVRSSGDESGSMTFWDWELFPMSGEGVEGSGLVLILVDRTRRHRALKDLEGSREELRQLALHLQELREDERKTVAREIHDELGGLLTALKMEISILGRNDVPLSGACLESYDSALELIDQSISMIQRLTSDLRPRILDDFGLVAAIEWHIKEFQKRAGIECALKVGSGSYIMEKNRTAAVFRILQESLTNVARHAHATRVLVSLRKLGGRLYLRVADNGIGIEDSQVSAATSYGLLGIRERAQSLGGQVSISGRKGRGTTLSLEIPLPREEAQ